MLPHSILTVTTPGTQLLVSLTAMKAELGITDAASDTRLNTLIAQASAICAGFANRVLGAETVTEVFEDGHWGGWSSVYPTDHSRLKLRRWPIQSVTSIVEDGVTLVVTTDYRIDAENGELRRRSNSLSKSWSGKEITVVYVGGYTLPADGAAFARACMDTVMALGPTPGAEALRQYNRIGVPGVVDLAFGGSAGSSEGGGMPPASARELLARYQDMSFRQ